MGKREARRLAESRAWTAAELLERIQSARADDQHRTSVVNQNMTHGDALDILERGIGDRTVFDPHAFNSRKASMDILYVTNVLRETA